MRLSVISKVVMTSLLVMGAVSVANAKHASYKEAGYKDMVYKDQPCQLPCLRDGFYVGGQAGYDAFRVRQGVSSGDFTSSNVNSLTGWMGGLFAGYGQYFDNYYLGAELLGNYNGSSQNINSYGDDDGDSLTQKVKAKGTWGIALLPGMKIQSNVLGYLRLGYNWTKFESTVSVVNGTTGGSFSSSKSNTQGGFDAGLGMETLLCDNWSLRTEYNHVWYSSSSFYGVAGVSDSVNISDNQFALGILYHFV